MTESTAQVPEISNQEILTSIETSFTAPNFVEQLADFSIVSVSLAESLLTPGLQTSIKVNSYIHNIPIKNFDALKGSGVDIKITRPILKSFGYPETLNVSQTVYRLGGRSSTDSSGTDNRKMINRGNEELTFHACDPTLLYDAANLVSKSWKCTTPDKVVSEVLTTCAGAKKLQVESCDPARDYVAENIHPFQVVVQQADAALAAGNDPSFVHYMTYENGGTHHFKSLKSLCSQAPIATLRYNMTGSSYSYPDSIMHYVFPCDFDLLSDILNGVNATGGDINSLAMFNPATKTFSLLGNQTVGCGLGGGVFKTMMSNSGSAAEQNMCPDFVYLYGQKRQARMGLLEKDKVALRLVIPWNPIYNVGKVITIELINSEDPAGNQLNYGSGNYLITALVHNIKAGGYSTITMDCVSQSVLWGEV